MTELALLAVALLLAYSNGANDNFKGVATLYGSGVLSYRQARLLSTLATVAGALAAVALAEALLKAFFGRGLVPSSVVDEAAFAAAVALAMALGGWLHSRRIAKTMSPHRKARATQLVSGQSVYSGLGDRGEQIRTAAFHHARLYGRDFGPVNRWRKFIHRYTQANRVVVACHPALRRNHRRAHLHFAQKLSPLNLHERHR